MFVVVLQLTRGKPFLVQISYDIFGVGALTLALVTSYHVFKNPPTGLTGVWTLLVPWPIFFLLVLVKLLVFFYSMIVFSGLLQPGKIRKFGAKACY